MVDRLPQAKKYVKKHKMLSIWHKVVLSLAVVMVFMTAYMLILPAITMESDNACNLQEHTHIEECYELVKVLTCNLSEDEALLSDMEDIAVSGEAVEYTSAVHIHTDECYTLQKQLVCTLQEHTHNEECSKNNKENQTENQSDSNVSADSLYNGNIKPGNLGNSIVNVSVEKSADVFENTIKFASPLSDALTQSMFDKAEIRFGTTAQYNADKDTVTATLSIEFVPSKEEIQAAQKVTDGDTAYYYFEYELPEELVNVPEVDRWIENDGDEDKFIFMITKQDNGKYLLKVRFFQAYVDEQEEIVDGEIHFAAEIGSEAFNEQGGITIPGEGQTWLDVPADQIVYPDNANTKYDITTKKTAGSYSLANNTITYTVDISSQKGTPDPINIEDKMSIGSSAVTGVQCDSVQVNKVEHIVTVGQYGSSETTNVIASEEKNPEDVFNADDNTLSMDLPALEGKVQDEDDQNKYTYYSYSITYTYKLDIPKNEDGTEQSVNTNISNKVNTIAIADNTNLTVKAEDSQSVYVNNSLPSPLVKDGQKTGDNTVTWTVKLDGTKTSLAGGVLEDIMLSEAVDESDITVTPDDGNYEIITDNEGRKSIKFIEDSETLYTITYNSHMTDWSYTSGIINKATFGKYSAEVRIWANTNYLYKSFNNVQDLGDGIKKVTWDVKMTVPENGIPAGTVTDTIYDADKGHYFSHDDAVAIVNTVNLLKAGNEALAAKLDGLTFYVGSTAYSDDEIENLGEDIKFTKFLYRFNDTVCREECHEISYSYTTTVDTTVYGNSYTYRNNINAVGNIADAYYPFTKGVIKTDGIGNVGNSAATSTDGKVVWIVRINLDEDAAPVEVTDTLPSQVTIDSLEMSYDNRNYTTIADSIGTDYTNTGTETVVEGNAVTTTIANANKGTLYLRYTCQLTEDCMPEKGQISSTPVVLENNASVKVNGIAFDTAEQTQEVTVDRSSEATKQIIKGVNWNPNKLNYSLKINPEGKKYGTDSTFELVDTLTYHSGNGNGSQYLQRDIELQPSTVKLYYAAINEDGEWIKGNAVDAELWSYNYKETVSTEWNGDTLQNIITAQLPNDGSHYIFEYTYVSNYLQDDADYWDKGVGAVNIAEITSEINAKSDEIKSEDSWSTSASGGSIGEKGTYVIYKISKEHNNRYLQGAKFKLYQYDKAADTYVDSEKELYETNENGYAAVNFNRENLMENTLYCLVEVAPPAGYMLPDNPEYLYFYYKDSSKEYDVDNMPDTLPDGTANLIGEKPVKYMENAEISTTSLKVDKVWLGINGVGEHTPDVNSIQVNLRRRYKPIEINPNAEYVRLKYKVNAKEDYEAVLPNGHEVRFDIEYTGSDGYLNITNPSGERIYYIAGGMQSGTYSSPSFTADEAVDGLLFTIWCSEECKFKVVDVTAENDKGIFTDDPDYLETYTITSDSWQRVIDNLPTVAMVNGNYSEIEYYVAEQPVEGYKASYEYDGNRVTITNTMQDKKFIWIIKAWQDKDGNSLSAIDVSAITFDLYRRVYEVFEPETVKVYFNEQEYEALVKGSAVDLVISAKYPEYMGSEYVLSVKKDGVDIEDVAWSEGYTYTYRFVVGNEPIYFTGSVSNWSNFSDFEVEFKAVANTVGGTGTLIGEELVSSNHTVTAPWTGKIDVTDLPVSGTVSVTNGDGTVTEKNVVYRYFVKEHSVSGFEENPVYENNEIDIGAAADTNGIVGTVNVTNKKLGGDEPGYVLPETGGTGTVIYTMAGMLMIIFAACCLYIRSVKRRG